MVRELERLVDRAVREAHRRGGHLASVTLSGGEGPSAVLRLTRELLHRRGFDDVPVSVEDPHGRLRLVLVEMRPED
ncbi:MAG: hypothetical protein ACQEXJ_24960 [Myxococcota bacterium]